MDEIELGGCCSCDTREGVRNIVLLPWKGAVPGHGWGCLICGLPSDGCSTVLCDPCLALYQDAEIPGLRVCRGYPVEDGREDLRAAIARGTHQHDETVDHA